MRKDTLSNKGVNALIALQVIVPISLMIYAIYRIYSSFTASLTGGTSGITMSGVWGEVFVWIDNIVYIYGILSLLMNLYIIPLAKEEFDAAINLGRNQKWGQSLRQASRNVRKKWLTYKDKAAKAQLLDQKTIKELLDGWKNKFAVILLIPLAIGSFILMPITFILIVMWLKIIVFDRSYIEKFEKVALLISMIVVCIIAIVIPFFDLGIFDQISGLLWTINIFYLIGIIFAILIFVSKMLSLQGISISGIKKKRFEDKKDKLKADKTKLKAEKKEFEQLKKEKALREEKDAL